MAKTKPVIDPQFVTNLKGKEFVLYSGLLDLAHKIGIRQLAVELIQFPAEDNNYMAVCKATLVSSDDETFVEVGDATPKNVNKNIAPHIVRMAATRAKARALRDFTNVGMTALEELGDLDDIIGDSYITKKFKAASKPEKETEPEPEPKPKPEPKPEPEPVTNNNVTALQLKELDVICKDSGIKGSSMNQLVQIRYGKELSPEEKSTLVAANLTKDQADEFIKFFQAYGEMFRLKKKYNISNAEIMGAFKERYNKRQAGDLTLEELDDYIQSIYDLMATGDDDAA